MVITEADLTTVTDKIITMDMAMVKAITEAIIIISTISIIAMMMDTRLNNMDHHVLYVVAIIIHQNIVLRVNMT